jgi:tetratricopeptide (TPR) repeat protein
MSGKEGKLAMKASSTGGRRTTPGGFCASRALALLAALALPAPAAGPVPAGAAAGPVPAEAAAELGWEDTLTASPEEVIKRCSAALEKKDTAPRAAVQRWYEARARAYLQLKQYRAAKEDLDELLKPRPKDPRWRCLRGLAVSRMGRPGPGLKEVDAVLEESPEYADGYVIGAMILEQRADLYERGLAYATRALDLDPKNAHAYFRRACLSYRLYDLRRCVEDCNRAIELAPSPAGPWGPDEPFQLRGLALVALQQPARALSNLVLARRLNPASAGTAYGLWMAYAELGRWQAAFAVAGECVRLDRQSFRTHLCWAESCVRVGRTEDGRKAAEKALALAPDDPRALAGAGNVYALAGDYAEALAQYDKALEKDPKSAAALVAKASLLATCPDAKRRDGRKAVELAGRVYKDPRLPTWELWKSAMALAAGHAECGEYREAVRLAEASLAMLGPHSPHCKEEYEKHLRLFRRGRPLRLEPLGKLPAKPGGDK